MCRRTPDRRAGHQGLAPGYRAARCAELSDRPWSAATPAKPHPVPGASLGWWAVADDTPGPSSEPNGSIEQVSPASPDVPVGHDLPVSSASPDVAAGPGNDEPYQALYRQYRPQRFAEVRGQDHVTRALLNAVRDGRVAHAYLFSGPRGTGKTSTARIFAMALNCEAARDGEPDGTCLSCTAIRAGSSMDVFELDAASNRRLEEMRDLLSRVALGTPGRWKVYIIDEVHQLTSDAASALLKTLEDPPSHVVFVLATTDPQRVLDTILSRYPALRVPALRRRPAHGPCRRRQRARRPGPASRGPPDCSATRPRFSPRRESRPSTSWPPPALPKTRRGPSLSSSTRSPAGTSARHCERSPRHLVGEGAPPLRK